MCSVRLIKLFFFSLFDFFTPYVQTIVTRAFLFTLNVFYCTPVLDLLISCSIFLCQSQDPTQYSPFNISPIPLFSLSIRVVKDTISNQYFVRDTSVTKFTNKLLPSSCFILIESPHIVHLRYSILVYLVPSLPEFSLVILLSSVRYTYSVFVFPTFIARHSRAFLTNFLIYLLYFPSNQLLAYVISKHHDPLAFASNLLYQLIHPHFKKEGAKCRP